MQFTVVFPILACIVATVHAAHYPETNAVRLSRGLPPNPPVRRSRSTVPNSRPSSIPGQCNSGNIHCCNRVTHAEDPDASSVTGFLGLLLSPGTTVGLDCQPMAFAGSSDISCNSQTVCCDNNEFDGLIATGCNAINL